MPSYSGDERNEEWWRHDKHWDCDEVTVSVAGAGGEQNLGVAVPADRTRRITSITIYHAGTLDSTIIILISGGATKLTIRMFAGSTFEWKNKDGIEFMAGQQSAVQSSDVTGGNTYVTARGVEAQ